MSKQFGLILPGQQKKAAVKPPTRPCIFDESSEGSSSGDESGAPPQMRPTRKPAVVSGPSLMERRVARNMQEKALAEDPTIFQYDELYDDMDNKREEAKETKKREPRKAKYIGRLLEHAEKRKLENELRIERQVQKDREAEGEMYKDKETFVTAAYREKLETIRKQQEQEKREEYLEAIGDVTKQKDLDGFYRHLYEQKLGTRQPVNQPKTASTTDEIAYKPIMPHVSSTSKQRTYRQRKSSDDDEDSKSAPTATSTGKGETKSHLANNIDADSDFSIDYTSDEEEQEKEQQQQQKQINVSKNAEITVNSTTQNKLEEADEKEKPSTAHKTKEKVENDDDDDDDDDDDNSKGSAANESEEAVKQETPVKPTIDRSLIWRKRTVGEALDAAKARYQERKRQRYA